VDQAMKRTALILLFTLAALPALAERVKLYLTDGKYQVVAKYEVIEDRVRYYSVERSQWEEIPLRMVDLARTKQEVEKQRSELAEEQQQVRAEEQFEKAMRNLVSRVPEAPGVYQILGEELAPLAGAEVTQKVNGRRSILQKVVPLPVVMGKTLVEIAGESSKYVVTTPRPEFYIRVALDEQIGIIRLKPGKEATRIVEIINSMPKVPEIDEQRELVDAFQSQAKQDLFKIWPMKPLEPGEYAVVEFTEGKANIRVWDFRYAVVAGSGPAAAKQ
jgi:hypothetical protein